MDLNSFLNSFQSATTVNFEYFVEQANVQNSMGSSQTDLNKSVQYKSIRLEKVNLVGFLRVKTTGYRDDKILSEFQDAR
jgi:hypothetical protein